MARESTAVVKPGKENPGGSGRRLSAQERHRRIAEAAYYKAERRNFVPGEDQLDWYEAEREIDSQSA